MPLGNTSVPTGQHNNNNNSNILMAEPTAFVSPTRSIWSFGAGRVNGSLQASALTGMKTLEEVRDIVARIESAQAVQDRMFHTSQLAFDFSNGVARMVPIIADKSGGRKYEQPLFFDKNGWNQLSTAILPRSGGNFVQSTALLAGGSRHSEEQRAAMYAGFNKLGASVMMAHAQCADKTLQFRTVLKRIGTSADGKAITARFVRAVVTQSYATYSNADMLSVLLSEMGNYSVYRLNLADSGIHFRLLDLKETDGVLETKIQYPTINGYNSETGQRRTGVNAGTVRLSCTNGMGDYATTSQYNWVHRGDPNRIARGMEDALSGIRTSQSTLIHEYNRALSTQIDDGYSWMEGILNGMNGVSQKQVAAVRTAMDDSTGSSPNTLAGVVDGMTLLAQAPEFDLWDAIDFEEKAVKVMRKGLRQASADKKLFAPA
jgi:hypothetical protein